VSGGLSKVAMDYVKKGDLIYIEGSIKTRSYEKDGQTKYIMSINATEMKMLGGKPQATNTPAPSPTPQPQTKEDDLPF